MAHASQAPVSAGGPTEHTRFQPQNRPAGTYGYTREEQIAALHKLREPFPRQEVRYRPQPWCKKCSEAQGWPKVCQYHREIKCQRCNGQKITDAHICLAYIGHAEATNRLLNVDPFWDWEPLSFDERGLPQFDTVPGLWIRLTVCGMTRIGYGDAGSKKGANAVKEIIGDAIRNAGMRFGMALNLWTTSDLEIIEPGVELAPELAAELGGPVVGEEKPQGSRPVPAPRTEQPAPASAQAPQGQGQSSEGGRSLEEFRAKVHRTWNHLDAMRQNLLEARKFWPDTEVPVGAEQTPTLLVPLLAQQVEALEKQPSGQDRSAA